MNFFNSASAQSVWKGYYYFKDNKVLHYEKVDDKTFYGVVQGSEGMEYDVTIDISKPKRSTCDCAHAEGTRKIRNINVLCILLFSRRKRMSLCEW